MFSVTVITRSAISIAGLLVRTTMEAAAKDCPKLWHENFMPELLKSEPHFNGETYGASWVVDEKAGIFDYWAAMPLAPDRAAPPGMSLATLPEGLYAELAVPDLQALSAAYSHVYCEWLPGQKAYKLGEQAPSYELYPADHMRTGKLFLYFPVAVVG